MVISEFVERVKDDLVNLGELGGAEMADTVGRLVRAVEPSLRDRFLEAVNELVAEASANGGPPLSLTVESGDLRLGVPAGEEPLAQLPSTGDLTARFALRVPEDMKREVEERAGQEGVSINSWIVRAIDGALAPPLRPPRPHGPRRMKGVGRS